LAYDCGATIIGGCCGTTPNHLSAMRKALDGHVKGFSPKLETIVEALGDFSSISDGTDDNTPTRKRQNRRHRTK
jgi:5-methyltetrahydrofolate--homocysteine methyltransferase